jgi:hypothetical protein
MNGFDITAICFLVLSILRGYRNGLAGEFYRLFRLAVALLAGTSLYGALSGFVTRILSVDSGWADPAMFVGTTVVAWRVLNRARGFVERLITSKMPHSYQAVGGAVAAAIKSAIAIAGIVTVFHLATWLPGHDAVSVNSVTSRILLPFISNR